MSNEVTFAICGCGQRGLLTYAPYAKEYPEKARIVAGADPDPLRLEVLRQEYAVSSSMCFPSAEALLKAPKSADVMIISTQDREHAAYAVKALQKGYHVLLEKPVSPDLAECLQVQQEAHRTGKNVVVCHVLRYTPFYSTIKAALNRGEIGKLISIDAVEGIGYWHFAHSYVRGNWKNSTTSSPMILAKSCHDMDLLRWLADSPCKAVSSAGSCAFFNPQNAPIGSADFCSDCAVRQDCPYDAEAIYLHHRKWGCCNGNRGWPCSVVTPNPTEDTLRSALHRGPYGRCVFHCDNDVADHQTVLLTFENNVTATFTVCAFTEECHRTIRLMGTHGEIQGDIEKNELTVHRFGCPPQIIHFDVVDDSHAGHGGGDFGLMDEVCNVIKNNTDIRTAIDASIESHFMAIAAEYSRLHGEVRVLMPKTDAAIQQFINAVKEKGSD